MFLTNTDSSPHTALRGRKRAPSSPPKPLRKWMHVLAAAGSKPAVIERMDSSVSAVTACNRCHHLNIKCVLTDEGARCSNWKAKHYKCSLVPAKEGLESKAILLGARLMRIAAGGPTKVQEKKEATKKAKALRRVTQGMFLSPRFDVMDPLKDTSRSWSLQSR